VKNRFWQDRSPLGRRIAPSSAPASIVGVVGDVHQTGLNTEMEPTIYMPLLDSVGGGVRPMSVALRTSTEPLAIMEAARGVIRSIDPQLPITDVQTMGTVVSDSMSRTSFTALLLVIAAVVGLFLGAVGIYGVIAYTVKQRTTELGIRQALGASAGTVRALVLRQGVATTIVGVIIGLLAAAALARVMQSLVYGIGIFDPITFVGGSLVFVAVAMLACLIPAQRAASIAPSEALRAD
jgi:predicted lysophospholipase L1 biosynthesis ABC-type transport system permease subunit